MTIAQFRRSMGAGVAFVVLLVVGAIVSFNNSPDIKSSDDAATTAAKFVHTLSSSSSRTGILVGAYLVLLSALAFVWYAQGLRSRLTAGPARLVGALGTLGAAALATAAMLNAVMAGAVSFGHEKVPHDGDTIRVVMDLFFPFIFVAFALTSAALIAVFAVHRTVSGLPAWLSYTAWLAVLGGIVAVIFLPMVLVLLWYLAVAIVGLTRPPATLASALG
jgi:hypothetical protein